MPRIPSSIPTFAPPGARTPPPGMPAAGVSRTPQGVVPAAIMAGVGRTLTWASVPGAPGIKITGRTLATADQRGINKYTRGEEELLPERLTPIERGHTYSAEYRSSVGKWVFTAYRVADVETEALLDGIPFETADAAVRARQQARITDIRAVVDAFFIDLADVVTLARRITDAGGIVNYLSPLPGGLVVYARSLLDKAIQFHDDYAREYAERRAKILELPPDSWDEVGRVILEEQEAAALKCAELSQRASSLQETLSRRDSGHNANEVTFARVFADDTRMRMPDGAGDLATLRNEVARRGQDIVRGQRRPPADWAWLAGLLRQLSSTYPALRRLNVETDEGVIIVRSHGRDLVRLNAGGEATLCVADADIQAEIDRRIAATRTAPAGADNRYD